MVTGAAEKTLKTLGWEKRQIGVEEKSSPTKTEERETGEVFPLRSRQEVDF
jgi:hypothetical protein